jgi:hypothetical protein
MKSFLAGSLLALSPPHIFQQAVMKSFDSGSGALVRCFVAQLELVLRLQHPSQFAFVDRFSGSAPDP